MVLGLGSMKEKFQKVFEQAKCPKQLAWAITLGFVGNHDNLNNSRGYLPNSWYNCSCCWYFVPLFWRKPTSRHCD